MAFMLIIAAARASGRLYDAAVQEKLLPCPGFGRHSSAHGTSPSASLSNPSKMPRAADSGEAFGMLKPRFISVSMGPRTTAWTVAPWPAKSALSDCVMLNAAAFERE